MGQLKNIVKKVVPSSIREPLRKAWHGTLSLQFLFDKSTEEPLVLFNSFFNRVDRHAVRKSINDLRRFDRALYLALISYGGMRAFEYSRIVNYFKRDFKGLKILDHGPGSSRFPAYMAARGGDVYGVELFQPMGGTKDAQQIAKDNAKFGVKIDFTADSKMPYPDNTFDLITSISAIEHNSCAWAPGKELTLLPKEEFHRKVKENLQEFVRITKPGGIVYITTDFYHPKGLPQGHTNAFNIYDLEPVIVNELESQGMTFTNGKFYNPELLYDTELINNFRNRYITTAAFLCRKKV